MKSRLIGTHLWLGITVGLMVLIWYGSGLYIHWRALPAVLSETEQARLLGRPFQVADVTLDVPDVLAQVSWPSLAEIHLRRAGPRLVYDVQDRHGRHRIVDAASGACLNPISEPLARQIARTYLPSASITQVRLLHALDAYSITLEPPIFRVTFSDQAKTRVYISPDKAAVVARARLQERRYYLFGSIPHFLNLNVPLLNGSSGLRKGLLVGFAGLAVLLVVSGVVFANGRFRARRPFSRGWLTAARTWHWKLGLGFSLTTILFLVTGIFYAFDGSPPPARILPGPEEEARVMRALQEGRPEVRGLHDLVSSGAGCVAGRIASIELKRLLEIPLYIVQGVAGDRCVIRADTGAPFHVDEGHLERVTRAFLGEAAGVGNVAHLTDYDAYYYGRDGRSPPLPVYRVEATDPEHTLLYVSATTGEVVGVADRSFRLMRWFVSGFHAWDWPFLLERPWLRDFVIIFLVGGGLFVSSTGLVLGIRRISRRRMVEVERPVHLTTPGK